MVRSAIGRTAGWGKGKTFPPPFVCGQEKPPRVVRGLNPLDLNPGLMTMRMLVHDIDWPNSVSLLGFLLKTNLPLRGGRTIGMGDHSPIHTKRGNGLPGPLLPREG